MTRLRLSAASVVALLVLVGCSGGDDTPAGDDGSAGPGVPEPTTDAAVDDDAAALLEAEGYLAEDGSVAFGPAGPTEEDAEVQAALCTYVFGPPEEVAERAGLAEPVLTEGSGYQMLGSNGSGVRCGWGDAEEPEFVLAVWGSEAPWIEEAREEFEAIVELPDGVGVAFYDDDAEAEPLPATDLEAWLAEAPAVTQSV